MRTSYNETCTVTMHVGQILAAKEMSRNNSRQDELHQHYAMQAMMYTCWQTCLSQNCFVSLIIHPVTVVAPDVVLNTLDQASKQVVWYKAQHRDTLLE